MMHGLAKT